jgi:hypothetical protein
MELWIIATMTLYLIPVIWFIKDFDFVAASVYDTFPDMKEGHVSVAILLVVFWPITAVVGILLGGDK